jgi:hypothetical protein
MHKNSPKVLLDRVAEVLKTGGGMPFINNDDIIISAYEKLGIPREDACNYANSNCWETLIQGMSNQEMIRGINFLYLLELAINGGKSFIHKGNRSKVKPPSKDNPMSFSAYVGPSNPVIDGVDTGDTSQIIMFISLSPKRMNSRSLPCIQHPYLNESLVYVKPHLSAQGIYFTN